MMILVPARAGSKGLPGKNTADFRGAPLVAWSIAAGRYLEGRIAGARLVVSTDDPVILALCADMGVSARARPAALAADDAGMAEVVLDAADWCGAERYVLLQPTSPLRLVSDLDRLPGQTGTVVSCTHPVEHPEDIVDAGSGEMVVIAPKTTRRQDRLRAYRFVDGSYYAGAVADLRAGRGFLPEGTRYETLDIPRAADIDTALDWCMAEALHDWLAAQGVAFVRP